MMSDQLESPASKVEYLQRTLAKRLGRRSWPFTSRCSATDRSPGYGGAPLPQAALSRCRSSTTALLFLRPPRRRVHSADRCCRS
jgi:hypothetical protein